MTAARFQAQRTGNHWRAAACTRCILRPLTICCVAVEVQASRHELPEETGRRRSPRFDPQSVVQGTVAAEGGLGADWLKWRFRNEEWILAAHDNGKLVLNRGGRQWSLPGHQSVKPLLSPPLRDHLSY